MKLETIEKLNEFIRQVQALAYGCAHMVGEDQVCLVFKSGNELQTQLEQEKQKHLFIRFEVAEVPANCSVKVGDMLSLEEAAELCELKTFALKRRSMLAASVRVGDVKLICRRPE